MEKLIHNYVWGAALVLMFNGVVEAYTVTLQTHNKLPLSKGKRKSTLPDTSSILFNTSFLPIIFLYYLIGFVWAQGDTLKLPELLFILLDAGPVLAGCHLQQVVRD
jgi:hypothetical protein